MNTQRTLKDRLAEVDKMIGHAIRAHRLRKQMSQEKLGDALGITWQQVQKYEKGTNRVSASALREICSILGCTFDDIMPASGHTIPDFAAPSDEGLKAQMLVEAMSPADRRRALAALRALEAIRNG